MKQLVIIGGAAPSHLEIDLNAYDRIIAADSGYDTAKRLSIPVTDAVGDFDSTSFRDELIAMGFVPCSHDKDESDTELAINKCTGDYDMIGGGEGRFDHILALIALMSSKPAPRLWFTEKDLIAAISSPMRIDVPSDRSISFFSFKGETHVKTDGLVWELDSFPLSLSGVSLSNRTKAGTFTILPESEVMMRMDLEDFRDARFAEIEA